MEKYFKESDVEKILNLLFKTIKKHCSASTIEKIQAEVESLLDAFISLSEEVK